MAAGATYEPIATTTLASAAASITFSSISSAYTDLKLIVTGTTDSAQYLGIRLNSDTGTNYSSTAVYGNGSAAGSYRITSDTYIYLNGIPTTSTTIPFFSQTDLFSYSGSTNKTTLTQFSMDKNGSGGVERSVGLWRNTSAISNVNIFIGSNATAKFNIGTTATLYGIKAA